MKKTLIYGLCSTKTPNKIKYVGKTTQNINKRIKDHIRESKKLLTKKDEWIQETIKSNYTIIYTIIEIISNGNWSDREKYWIKSLDDLTNTSSGGAGGRGLIYTMKYNELKSWVHINLKEIDSGQKWINYVKNNNVPEFIPTYPNVSYKNRGWLGWGDFLYNYKVDISKRSRFTVFFNYTEAKDYITSLKIKNSKHWKTYIKNNKINNKMPSAPDVVFKKTNDWLGWGEFLGTNNIHNKDKNFIPYPETKNIIKKLKLKKYGDWEIYINSNGLISGIPRHPQRYYKKDNTWISWNDFLN